MKYYVSATPGPIPPTPEHFDAAIGWLDEKVNENIDDADFGSTRGSQR